MNNEVPNREVVVDFSATQVKNAINTVRKSVTNAGFQLGDQNANDIMGIYPFNVFKGDSIAGLITGSITLSVQELAENKTKILISGIATGTNVLGPKKILELQDYMLKMISQVLTGSFNPQMEIEKNTGCFGVVVLIVLSALLTAIAIFQ